MSQPTDPNEGFWARYAWVPLFVFTLLMLIIGLGGFAGPVSGGSALSAFFASEETEQILASRLRGTFVLGMVIFGMALILVPFRRQERWAWYVLWYYPTFFVLHVIAFGTLIPDGLFAIVSSLALLATYPKTFGKPPQETGR